MKRPLAARRSEHSPGPGGAERGFRGFRGLFSLDARKLSGLRFLPMCAYAIVTGWGPKQTLETTDPPVPLIVIRIDLS